MAVSDLSLLAAKTALTMSGDDIHRLIATPAASFVALLHQGDDGEELLPAQVLIKVMRLVLSTDSAWVSHSMNDHQRKKFTAAVGTRKASESGI